MRFSFIAACLILGCGSFLNQEVPADGNMPSFYFKSQIQVIDGKTGEYLIYLKDSTRLIYLRKNLIVYHKSIRNDETRQGMDAQGHLQKEELLKTTYEQQYFFQQGNAKTGKFYTSLHDKNPVNVNLDSLLSVNTIKGAVFYTHGLKLVYSMCDKSGRLNEKYVPRTANIDKEPDTVFFYFDNTYKIYPYTLCKELDSLKSEKVYKVRILFNAREKSAYRNVPVPKTELIYEMKHAASPPNAMLDSLVKLITIQ